MKSIALHTKHIALNAKMINFGGYVMPLKYQEINVEHNVVRNNVGVFDVSHMGQFFVKGIHALDFLQKTMSNDVSKLVPGRAQYTTMLNDSGGIIDDLIIYCLEKDCFFLVVNATNIEKNFIWLKKHLFTGVTLENCSDDYGLLALQGPKSPNLLNLITNINVKELKYYHFEKGILNNGLEVLIAATGYTGEKGFEIYFKNRDAIKIWDYLFEKGKVFNLQPIGLGARDTLRLEMGYCLYGNDIDETITPYEANLGWITKLDTNFIGSDALREQKRKGITKQLTPFIVLDRRVPRKGYELVNSIGEKIGEVTSGTVSVSTQKIIGLAYINLEEREKGEDIFMVIRDKKIKIEITTLPFYKKN